MIPATKNSRTVAVVVVHCWAEVNFTGQQRLFRKLLLLNGHCTRSGGGNFSNWTIIITAGCCRERRRINGKLWHHIVS